MTVHLLKLCVGAETVEDLRDWQSERLKTLAQAGKTVELCHRTRQMPRRRPEILDGGSLYWVVKGFVLVRQRIVDLRADTKYDGTPCCGIVLDPELFGTRSRKRRAFQGWRYLAAADAPRDADVLDGAHDDMPHAMREDLRELRLIDW